MVGFEVTDNGYAEPTFAVTVQVFDDATNRPTHTKVLEYPLESFVQNFPTTAARQVKVRDDMLSWASTVKMNNAATNEFGPYLNMAFDIP